MHNNSLSIDESPLLMAHTTLYTHQAFSRFHSQVLAGMYLSSQQFASCVCVWHNCVAAADVTG